MKDTYYLYPPLGKANLPHFHTRGNSIVPVPLGKLEVCVWGRGKGIRKFVSMYHTLDVYGAYGIDHINKKIFLLFSTLRVKGAIPTFMI